MQKYIKEFNWKSFFKVTESTDFASLFIVVEKLNSSPKERLSEARYFIWKRKLIESPTK